MIRPYRLDRLDLVSLALLGGAGAITGAVWERLPERMPIHFDLHGNADGWASRPVGTGLLLGTSFVVWALLRFGAAVLPKAWRERFEASPVAALATLTVAFLVAMHLFVLWAALHPGASIGSAFSVTFGVFWVVLAMVLPRVRRNPFVGVRTAWTLSSDENWARTHRFASWAFALGGLVAIVCGLASAPAVAIAAILASALVPVVYSFVVAHRLPPSV